MLKVNLDYVTSKLDYKNEEQIIDLYTLRIRRTKEESLEDAIKSALCQLVDDLKISCPAFVCESNEL